jgi:hypothetical protein
MLIKHRQTRTLDLERADAVVWRRSDDPRICAQQARTDFPEADPAPARFA